MKWFAVQTYSGYEMRVKASIDGEVKKRAMEDVFGEVLIPTETVEEVVNGKRRQVKRKFMPGYILVRMELSDETEYLVTATSKVSGFVGVPKNRRVPPIPVPDREVARLTKQIVEGVKSVAPAVLYEAGETVRVKEGPFENFNGNIEEVKPDKQKVMVTVSIFGRSTPVELDFSQIEKVVAGAS
ncbi:MAG: transcription termination/antitermination protein NusG [Deltaproteobacteria bacterium]|nr:transcription termination/antitermination protein NusG [Deltaproteobacteria bacterium]